MKIHKFNANVNKIKRHLKQDSGKQVRKLTTSLCVFVVIVGIVYFSYAKFEEGKVFDITNATVGEFFAGTYSEYLAQCDDGIAECIKSAPHKQRENVLSDNTVDNNLRYVGANPNNYIKFNNELWRIIGVMNNVDDASGNKASRVKIIKSESIGGLSWYYDAGGGYNNNWVNSTLNDLLNNKYYYGEKSSTYYNNSTTGTTITYNGLNDTARDMVETINWNIAGQGYGYVPNDLYTAERGNSGGGTGTFDSRWIGKVALPYASDFSHATSGGSVGREECLSQAMYNGSGNTYWRTDSTPGECSNNSWMFKMIKSAGNTWTIVPRSDTNVLQHFMYYNSSSGGAGAYYTYDTNQVFPTLYLKDDINIISGSGTSSDPYRLSIEGFEYTGGEQSYLIAKSGTYKLETWGAQGGDKNNTNKDALKSGYGGYSVGNISLNKNESIYLFIGQKGPYVNSDDINHTEYAYPNGGAVKSASSNYGIYYNGGGGSTHIAKENKLIQELASDSPSLLIVAGGGGGIANWWDAYGDGGSGGGFLGVSTNGNFSNIDATGGTQNSVGLGGGNQDGMDRETEGLAGKYGQGGGVLTYNVGNVSGGGGGGYFGGGASWGGSGAGGSGYIANSLLSNKHMYCYNCQTSTDESTYTKSDGTSSCHMATARADCAKEGNGYAQITYIGN